MSIDIVFIVIAIVVLGILIYGLTPRGLDHFGEGPPPASPRDGKRWSAGPGD